MQQGYCFHIRVHISFVSRSSADSTSYYLIVANCRMTLSMAGGWTLLSRNVLRLELLLDKISPFFISLRNYLVYPILRMLRLFPFSHLMRKLELWMPNGLFINLFHHLGIRFVSPSLSFFPVQIDRSGMD